MTVGRGEYITKEHDSFTMSANGEWDCKSRGIGGTSALDYLLKIKSMGFVEAVKYLNGVCLFFNRLYFYPLDKNIILLHTSELRKTF